METGLQFTYAIDPIVLLANGRVTGQVQILDNPFKALFLVATSTGRFTALIKDGSSKRPFSNVEVIDTLQWGTAQNPMPLLQPYVFSQRGQIQVDVTDISAAGNTIRLAFIGVELVG